MKNVQPIYNCAHDTWRSNFYLGKVPLHAFMSCDEVKQEIGRGIENKRGTVHSTGYNYSLNRDLSFFKRRDFRVLEKERIFLRVQYKKKKLLNRVQNKWTIWPGDCVRIHYTYIQNTCMHTEKKILLARQGDWRRWLSTHAGRFCKWIDKGR